METIIQNSSFKIIGISVRTTNKDGQSASDMGQLWNRFYSDNILSAIPGRISDDIYSVYTDYKSDYTEDYTAIIGCRVNSTEPIPDGLAGVEIQAGQYIKFIAQGEMPGAVIKTWQEIWDKDNILKRKYSTDYEVYGDTFHHPEKPEVEIYIAT